MKLSPALKETPSPAYPQRIKRQAARWWHRGAVAVATLSLLGLMSCEDDQPVRYPGLLESPYFFVCADERPDTYIGKVTLLDWQYGFLCGEQTAWAEFLVETGGIFQIALVEGVERSTVALLAPDGEQIAQLDSDRSYVNVELESGTYTVAVDAVDPITDGYGGFSISIEHI